MLIFALGGGGGVGGLGWEGGGCKAWNMTYIRNCTVHPNQQTKPGGGGGVSALRSVLVFVFSYSDSMPLMGGGGGGEVRGEPYLPMHFKQSDLSFLGYVSERSYRFWVGCFIFCFSLFVVFCQSRRID